MRKSQEQPKTSRVLGTSPALSLDWMEIMAGFNLLGAVAYAVRVRFPFFSLLVLSPTFDLPRKENKVDKDI